MKQSLIEIENLYQLYTKTSRQEEIVIGRLFLGFSLLYLEGVEIEFDLHFRSVQELLLDKLHKGNFCLNDDQIDFIVRFLKEYPNYLIELDNVSILYRLGEVIEVLHNEIFLYKDSKIEHIKNESSDEMIHQDEELLARLEECDNNEYEIAEIEEKIRMLKSENISDERISELNKQLYELKKYDYHTVLKEIEQAKEQVKNQSTTENSDGENSDTYKKSANEYMTLWKYCESRFGKKRKGVYTLISKWLIKQKILENDSSGGFFSFKTTEFGREIGVRITIKNSMDKKAKTTVVFLSKNAQNFVDKYFKELDS